MAAIKVQKFGQNIYVVSFESRLDLAATFLRFQEYYESPKFKRKVFSLDDFKKWYATPKGEFSYYRDWSGFNIPSRVLRPFYEKMFDPLSQREKRLLTLFADKKPPFYIVGVCENCSANTLSHEIAHALFYTCGKYKSEVLGVLKRFELSRLRMKLIKLGYDRTVILDEVQAYAVGPSSKTKLSIPAELRNDILKIFRKHREQAEQPGKNRP